MTTVYIGPYLVIPPTPRQTTSLQRVCANRCDSPAIARPAKFCANCGGAVVEETVPVEVVGPLPIQALAMKWTDYVFRPEHGQRHPGGDMWLPNHGGHGVSLSRGSEDTFAPLQLAALDGAAMLEKASVYYAGFLAALKADHGVEPRWEVGVVAYS